MDIPVLNALWSEETTDLVLNKVNLHVPAGSYMALVGSSGAGKSTLCSLIPRFYDVTDGTIRIDGKDIRDITLKCLRSQIGIVQQDVYLFVGTVYCTCFPKESSDSHF